jgi:hypothetical protein
MEPWEDAMKRNAEPTAAWARRWNIAAGGRRDRADPTTTYTGYAGWVRAGWIPILDRLAEDLIALGWDRTLDQVNKKFGGLRFFIGTGSPPLGRDVRDRIARRTAWAEAESLRTCEECGAPGRSTQPGGEGGVVETACPRCFEVKDAEVRARRAEEEREQAERDAEMRAEEEELAKNDPEYRAYLEEYVWNRDAASLLPAARLEIIRTPEGMRVMRFFPDNPANDTPGPEDGETAPK